MLHYLHIPLAFGCIRILLRSRFPYLQPAFSVLDTLLKLSAFGIVVCDTALRGTLLTVRLFTAKGTTQVLTVGITWMGKEEDMAMLTALQAPPQVGVGSQNRPQHDIILKDEITAGIAPVVPIRSKFEMLRDPYGKKPKLSLMILM